MSAEGAAEAKEDEEGNQCRAKGQDCVHKSGVEDRRVQLCKHVSLASEQGIDAAQCNAEPNAAPRHPHRTRPC